ncbi:hypothetical protein L202_05549 [Cryptococcus amylolentus CBS 6039]|uniref:Uncharacterized protein n=2 Tax=Cryptococcus amylolentus TaxID=104669 RepID=A0A1E3HKX1_9TREE|nr:hypothetical protein L202_05549 [Cryptococcus amylolentus CBS 6039]ODN76988.1 hypothetical protein L202_05549 [Cryptococcus amylolentus CBS 6039]
MWGGYWAPFQSMYGGYGGYGSMMSPYFAGGLGTPFGMNALGYGMGAAMNPPMYGISSMGIGNPYAYTGMYGLPD